MENVYKPLVWLLTEEPTDYSEVIKLQSDTEQAISGVTQEHENIVKEGID